MNHFKLFSKLKGSDIVNLVLLQKEPNKLDYFLMSKTINYMIINRGTCAGNIDKQIVTMNINLSSLFYLLDKQMDFRLEVVDGRAMFISATDSKNKVRIHPLSIEFADEELGTALKTVFEFDEAKENDTVNEIDLRRLKQFSNIAAKSSRMLQITREYTVLEFQDAFLFYKTPVLPLAISGAILKNLLTDGGRFYLFKDKLVYVSPENTDYVFLTRYLPRTTVDLDLINEGKVYEKYTFNCNDAARLLSYMRNAYPTAVLDMAKGALIMSNDTKERIECDLTLTDVKTVELEKMKKDGVIRNITMSTIKLPTSAVYAFSLFYGEVEVYVKKHKVVIKQDDYYFVFGK